MLAKKAVISVALLSAFPLAGCGDSKLNTGQIEDQLKTRVGATTPLKSVSCPDDVTAKKGDTFICKVTVASNGKSFDVKVTQQDDNGHVNVAPVPGSTK
jgi:uncharacterized lipoprotein